MNILDRLVDFRCVTCDAPMGQCDCWKPRYTARLVRVEGGWEARLERADGQAPNIWPYKRLNAARRKIAEWAAKGYEVAEE